MLLQTAVKNNCRIERILNGTRYLKPLMELKHMIGKSYVLLLLKFMTLIYWKDFPGGPVVKNPAANAGDARDSGLEFLDQENPLEKRIAVHSSILAWRIPWTKEPEGYSPQSCRVRHDLMTFTLTPSLYNENITSVQSDSRV